MDWSDLKARPPKGSVRVLLVAEVLGYLGLVLTYVWVALPARDVVTWRHVAFFAFAVGLPLGANRLHGDRFRDGGVRLDNFAASARPVGVATAIMLGGIVATGLVAGGFHWVSVKRFAEISTGYVTWGIAQQYLLQSFALRRLLQAGMASWPAAVTAAAIFGAMHAPNWALVAVTTGAGIVWCRLFLRWPNILTLGLAHGLLAVVLFHAWPEAWMQNFTIGPVYVNRILRTLDIYR